MADAYETLIANAVVAELNDPARTWQTPAVLFTARGPWTPTYSADELVKLCVSVLPLRLRTTKLARGKRQADYVIGVAFKQMVTVEDAAAVSAVTKIVQDVHDFLDTYHELATLAGAKVMQADRDEIYDVNLLYDQRAFDTVIEVTVRVCR